MHLMMLSNQYTEKMFAHVCRCMWWVSKCACGWGCMHVTQYVWRSEDKFLSLFLVGESLFCLLCLYYRLAGLSLPFLLGEYWDHRCLLPYLAFFFKYRICDKNQVVRLMWASPFTYWATLVVPTLTFLSTYRVGYADASRFQESCFISLVVRLWACDTISGILNMGSEYQTQVLMLIK